MFLVGSRGPYRSILSGPTGSSGPIWTGLNFPERSLLKQKPAREIRAGFA